MMFTKMTTCYEEAVHWKRNVFTIPAERAGKEFFRELVRLFRAYAEKSQTESFAFAAVMILPHLILQKLHWGSKSWEHSTCVERRMRLCHAGDLDSLLQEARTIQQRLGAGNPQSDDNDMPRVLANLMMKRKVKTAIRLLTEDTKGSPLPQDKVIPLRHWERGSKGHPSQEVSPSQARHALSGAS